MTWKCCVPGCNTDAYTAYIDTVSMHKFPKELSEINLWLETIGRSDMINASSKILTKLKICSKHFSDDMIVSHKTKHCLKYYALPVMNLPKKTANFEASTSYSNATTSTQTLEIVRESPKRLSLLCGDEYEIQFMQTAHSELAYKPDTYNLRKKQRLKRELSHNKSVVGSNQCRKKKKLHCGIKWEKATADISSIQNIFSNIIETNFEHATRENRYTAKQKALALTLYKTMGKHAYGCLQNVFHHIPSIDILQLTLHKIRLSPGLQPLILKHLKTIARNMSKEDKVCVLLWKETPIQPNITYDIHRDIIYGFEDWGDHRVNKVADRVLMFMLCGLNSPWKVPVSYSFYNKHVRIEEISYSIAKQIYKINKVGFHVICTVCEPIPLNLAAIKGLLRINAMHKKNKKMSTFEVENIEIIPLCDPLHLLRDVRNSLLTKDLVIKCKNNIPKPGCTVTEDNKELQVKVKKEITIAQIESFFNDLFDSVNGSKGTSNEHNELRRPLTKDSVHHAVWANAKNILLNMCYVKKKTRDIAKFVSVLTNWLFTVNAFQKIWKIVQTKYGFSELNTSYCSQHLLRNFFSQIENHVISNTKPTLCQFEESFITLLTSNIMSISIIDDKCEVTYDSSALFPLEQCLEDDVSNIQSQGIDFSNYDEPSESSVDEIGDGESIVALLSKNPQKIINFILKEVDYCSECDKSMKSCEFPVYVKQIVYAVNKLLNSRAHHRNILKIISRFSKNWNINMDWHKCNEHHTNMFKTMVHVISIKTIAWWCQEKNRLKSK